MNYKKPEAKQLSEMLGMITGGNETAKSATDVDTTDITHTAIYVNDEGEKVATCSCGLATAAALGCALSMIPPGGAEGMVEDKELTKTATDNFYEVMNIFSSLLMDDKSAHLKLTTIEPGAEEQFKEGEAEGFKMSLGAYGAGEVIFNYS